MFDVIYSHLNKGVQKIKNNPQLIYTVFVAVVIIGAFVFMANRFIGIANNAEERLVNVRIGSLQDAFVSFAGDRINETDYLNSKIKEIVSQNETIRSFKVIEKKTIIDNASTTIPNALVVVASNFQAEVGKIDTSSNFLYSLASGNPDSSITVETNENGERSFKTARAINDLSGNILGVVMTTQTLSAADKAIQDNILNSIYLLVAIIILIMFLFLRHSKIIDYMDLYKRLKEVDQLKDDFLSMASHELRTPLSIIRGYAEFIREAPELSTATKDFAEKIDISVKGLDSLVADILDVSRIEQGRMSFKLEKIKPDQILSDVVSSLEIPAKEKGLSITFDKNAVKDDQYINVDKERLKQILVNVVGNAVKYTLKGSIKISQYEENNRLYIRISDTGVGISAEERERLFEKFYRIRTKETEEIRGTGLGLWITQKIIKEMRGSISVESIKGVGSHFIISFPLFK
jgi:signal transduction histidine kinase